MKRTMIVAAMAVAGLLLSVNADPIELVTNGDLETDGYPGTVSGDTFQSFTGWASNNRADDKLSFDAISHLPGGVSNSVLRMRKNQEMHQTVATTAWDADSTFTLSFNGAEANWKYNNVGNFFFPRLKNEGGTQLWIKKSDMDKNNDGTAVADWTTAQTFSYDITGAELIATGNIAAGDDILLSITSANNDQSINWIDNVSLTVIPEPATLGLVVAIGGGIIFIRRCFMI